MSIKICLILFGTLIALAAQKPDEKTKEDSLSSGVLISDRLGRSVNRKKKTSQKSSGKNSKSSRKIKKSRTMKNIKKEGKKKLQRNKKKMKSSRGTGQKKEKNNLRQVAQDTPVPVTCLKDSVLLLYNGLRMASNFDRQLTRLQNWNTVIAKKFDKAGDFKQSSVLLENFASDCPSENDQLAVKSLAQKLGSCQTNITDKCQPPVVNQAKIDECKPIVDGFKSQMEECFDVTSTDGSEEACKCWEGETLADLFESLKKCIIKEIEADVKVRFKECKTAVTECKKAQTEFFPLYNQCTLKLKCPDIGVSCISDSPNNTVKVIENSSMYNCSKNFY